MELTRGKDLIIKGLKENGMSNIRVKDNQVIVGELFIYEEKNNVIKDTTNYVYFEDDSNIGDFNALMHLYTLLSFLENC